MTETKALDTKPHGARKRVGRPRSYTQEQLDRAILSLESVGQTPDVDAVIAVLQQDHDIRATPRREVLSAEIASILHARAAAEARRLVEKMPEEGKTAIQTAMSAAAEQIIAVAARHYADMQSKADAPLARAEVEIASRDRKIAELTARLETTVIEQREDQAALALAHEAIAARDAQIDLLRAELARLEGRLAGQTEMLESLRVMIGGGPDGRRHDIGETRGACAS